MANQLREAATRKNTWAVRLFVNGESFGIWDVKTGGEVDSEESKYSPGGMLPTIVLGGKKITGNVTLNRFYDLIDDHSRINTLIKASGSGKIIISQRPMDPDGNEFGASITYIGKLKRTNPPETDGNSGDAALIEVECTIAGEPSAI